MVPILAFFESSGLDILLLRTCLVLNVFVKHLIKFRVLKPSFIIIWTVSLITLGNDVYV